MFRRVRDILSTAGFETRRDRIDSRLLLAQACVRLNDPEGALKALAGIDALPSAGDERLTAAALKGAALLQAGKLTEGQRMLDGLGETAHAASRQVRAEIEYYRALSRWPEQRFDEAQRILEGALPLAEDALRGRFYSLLGWIDFQAENYSAAARQFVTAIDIFGHANVRDPYLSAVVLGGLSSIAADTIDLGLGRIVRREFAAFAWSSETEYLRFSILGDLTNLALLDGDIERAWLEQQQAVALSVGEAYAPRSLVGMAYISRLAGDRFACNQYLALAGSLLLYGDLAAVDPGRRRTLLTFVAEVNAEQQETADAALALFDRTDVKSEGPFHLQDDRRDQAYELLARGRHARRGGDRVAARRYLQQSLDLWLTLAQRRYTAIAAFDLAELTHEQQYASLAREQLRQAPQAFIAAPTPAGAVEPAALAALTPSERRVLAQLTLGRRSQQIADTFDRSIHTINNQTRKIFLAFKVTSRASLIVDCKRLGILELLQAEAEEVVSQSSAPRAKRVKRKR
jgi:DNA-binding CsgD family transcriptional regulator